MSRRRRRLPDEPVAVEITDLAHDGRGVGRVGDKVTFVHGALPGETVSARLTGRNRRFDEAVCVSVDTPSPERVTPECPWFGYCGGCALQHLDPVAQRSWKHSRLVENLRRIGDVEPERWLEPLAAEPWEYRRRARLSARNVPGKGRVLVGFRELAGRYVAEIEHCRILYPAFSDRLMDLSGLIGHLSIPSAVPQIEVAAGDDTAAIVLRHLEPLTDDDRDILTAWSAETGIAVYLQSKGPDTVSLLAPEGHRLSYRLPAFDLEMRFHPQHFVQINPAVNRALVDQALALMDPGPAERILDLFCGLGNFTLPLARRAGRVTGVEGEQALVDAARDNARANGLENVELFTADLTDPDLPWVRSGFDGVLIDPPRSGAAEVLDLVHASGARRVVYVSCDPATLARDAGMLVRDHGFRLCAAGIADMFPHTAHVESMALFERKP